MNRSILAPIRRVAAWWRLIPAMVGVVACIASPAASSSWASVGQLGTARSNHAASLLTDGRVLVAGGRDGNSDNLSGAEVYDSATGVWTATGELGTARSDFTATLLRDGRVLVVGGLDSSSATLTGAALAGVEIYDPANGTWTATGTLITARFFHTATLLPDGRVLVSGGLDSADAITGSVEIYDPATGTWAATGNLRNARHDHTATLLPNGQVLVAGGLSSSNTVTASAEIYDPTMGAWVETGDLTSARREHTATLLRDGRVLVAAGFNGTTILASAELYDPGTGVWSSTGNLDTALDFHSATLLPDGGVLLVGGGILPDSAEIYDPDTGTWIKIASPTTGRSLHTATLLPGGRVLVGGGITGSGPTGVTASAEVFDPNGATFIGSGDLVTARADHTATLLPDGRVLVSAGSDTRPIANAEVYDATTDRWSETDALSTPRVGHTTTSLPDGRVLSVGGIAPSGFTASAEVYDVLTGMWTADGALTVARSRHTATLLSDGRVLVAGGIDKDFIATTSLEIYDPATGEWTAAGDLVTARFFHTATLLADGRVLIAGGVEVDVGGPSTASAELYDPTTGTSSATGVLTGPRSSHTGSLLADGRVLVAGGNGAASTEVYDPVTGTWSVAGDLTTHRIQHTATLLPDGRVIVAGGRDAGGAATANVEDYDPATGTWRAAGNLVSPRLGHTATVLLDGRVLFAAGFDGSNRTVSAEIYDRSLDFDTAWQPRITSAPAVVPLGGAITLTGTGFRGVSEASGGNSRNSATNYPVVQLRRLDNGALRFLDVDPVTGWSDTSFTSLPIRNFSPGPALATVFTNGIPSESVYLVLDSGDGDSDGIGDAIDNCPLIANPPQTNTDGDREGDVCDADDDGDTLPDVYETDNGLNSLDAADALVDSDGDGFSNVAEFQSGTLAGSAASAPSVNSDVRLISAVLPTSRSVSVGDTATAFATIINLGTAAGVACKLSLASTIPSDFTFATTDPETNATEGMSDFPTAAIAPLSAQTYVFAITPTAAFPPTEVALEFSCANAGPAPVTVGLNSLLISASDTPVPDILAIAATVPNNNSIVTLAAVGDPDPAAFSVAAVNLGASGAVTISADAGVNALPISIAVCETNPSDATCMAPPAPSVTTTIGNSATATFGLFATLVGSPDDVPFDPASNRIFVRFVDASGVSRGATSVAVRARNLPIFVLPPPMD